MIDRNGLIVLVRGLYSVPKKGACWCPLGKGEEGWFNHSGECAQIQEGLDSMKEDGLLRRDWAPAVPCKHCGKT